MTKILIDEAVVRFVMDAIDGFFAAPDDEADQEAQEELLTARSKLRQALADAALDALLDKMADNARELGIGLHDCDHDWKYIGSKRQAMWECTKCGMYKVPDEQGEEQ